MPDSGKHESEDPDDFEVLDASDTLDGDPGDDPLDRGVAAPDRWTAAMRYALSGEEEDESLDELLAEEEPDDEPEDDPGTEAWDDNVTAREVTRLGSDSGPDGQ